MSWRPFPALIGWLGAVALRALGSTWRYSIEGDNPLRAGAAPILGAFWHRNMLIAAFAFRDRSYGVPVSRSRDGELIVSVLRRLGYTDLPRGSSTRGGAAALRRLVRIVRAGTTVSIQTDGPRGPARKSKDGVATLARLTGAEIVAIGFSASPCVRFRSWDGTLLPLPFARVVCAFGTHFSVASETPPEREEEVLLALDLALNRLTDQLDDRMGLRDEPSAAG
ncbi:MAG: lysophospholipid acyltransferase family protein [Myxococcota bacterium]